MSKSDTNVNGFVLMLDDADTIVRKFKARRNGLRRMRARRRDKPGVTNLMSIYSVFTGRDYAAIEKEFAGRGCGEFKLAVAEVVKDAFAPIQAEYKRILADKGLSGRRAHRGRAACCRHCGPHSDKKSTKSRFLQI